MSQINQDSHHTEGATFNLKEMIFVAWRDRLKIVLITSFISISSIIYVLSLANGYTSVVYLAPSDAQVGSLSQIQTSGSSSTGGIASLAGSIGLGGGGQANTVTSAIKIMKSWGFIESFITDNGRRRQLRQHGAHRRQGHGRVHGRLRTAPART